MLDSNQHLGNLALALTSLVCSLALAEFVLFIIDCPASHRLPEKDPHLELAEPDSLRRLVGWTNARSGSKTFRYDSDPRGYFGPDGSVTHTTNSLGFRGPEFSRAKPDATLRIAALGDSFTLGEGVHDSDTYPARLERVLARENPGRRVEVQNWGVGGYNTVQTAALFESLVLEYAPDVVVLGFTVNDAEPVLLRVDPTTQRIVRRAPGMEILAPAVERPHRGWERLRLVRLARMASRNRELTRAVIENHRETYAADSSSWAACRAAIRRIGDRCRGLGLGCFAVVFPLLWELSEYPLADIHERVIRELRFAGFETIDLLPVLETRSGPDLWVHPTDQHPNEEVHAITARLLADRIPASLQPDRDTDEERRE
jgi:hypothetical protein